MLNDFEITEIGFGHEYFIIVWVTISAWPALVKKIVDRGSIKGGGSYSCINIDCSAVLWNAASEP